MKNRKIFVALMLIAVLLVGAFALCACDKTKNGDAFAQNTAFKIDNSRTNIMGMLTGGFLGIIEDSMLNMEQTYFEFGADGNLHAQIQTKAGLFDILDDVFSFMGMTKEDVEKALSSFSVGGMVNTYVESMFPGFKQKLKDGDLQGALGLIYSSLGFNITGLDIENPEIKEAVQYIGETMRLPGNLLDIIPKDTVLTLVLDTQYSIRKVSTYDGETYEAIYLGYDVKDNPNTQPFGVFTLRTNEEGKKELDLRIEFMNIDIGLLEK